MDENKIVKLNIKTEGDKASKKEKPSSAFGFFHTNPIIKEMFISNMFNKKKKFSLKDFFRL
ncbi:hypothetical protein II906_13605 [bacterium]|nr:hypothetical protein [bacterium]